MFLVAETRVCMVKGLGKFFIYPSFWCTSILKKKVYTQRLTKLKMTGATTLLKKA